MAQAAQVLKTTLCLSSPATGQGSVSFSVLLSEGEAGCWVGNAHQGAGPGLSSAQSHSPCFPPGRSFSWPESSHRVKNPSRAGGGDHGVLCPLSPAHMSLGRKPGREEGQAEQKEMIPKSFLINP